MGSRGARLVALAVLAALSGCIGGQAPLGEGPGSDKTPSGTLGIDPADADELADHPKATLEWKKRPDLPTPRRDFACTLHDGDIWVIGGINDASITESRVDVFDIETGSWSRNLPLPKPVHGATAASVGNELFVMGGYLDLAGRARQTSDDVYALSQVGFWTEMSPLPGPLAEATAVVRDDTLLLVGGHTGSKASDTVWLRSPTMKNWADAGSLNQARVAPGAILLDDALYALGGQVDSQNNGSGEAISLREGNWLRSISPMPTPRIHFATATAGGYVYIIGGYATDTVVNSTEVYHVPSDVWWVGPALPEQAQRGCAVAAGDGIHFLGGQKGGVALDQHWLLTWL